MSAEPFAQLQSHSRVVRNNPDVSRLHAVLCHNPELIADACVAHWSAARLPRLATPGFEEPYQAAQRPQQTGKLPTYGVWGKGSYEVKALSPHDRSVIALRSPDGIGEVGLCL